jgi:flagella basal body P-ring formation protein FlgA
MEAQRALSAGTVVRASDVIRPQLVRRGEPVTITLRDGGLSISTEGRALGSGAAGDFVRVVSLSTNRTLDGVVEGTGAIRVSAR